MCFPEGLEDMYSFHPYSILTKEFFRTCNVLPFSCTHLALGKVKDPRYMQNKKDSRISLNFDWVNHGQICNMLFL